MAHVEASQPEERVARAAGGRGRNDFNWLKDFRTEIGSSWRQTLDVTGSFAPNSLSAVERLTRTSAPRKPMSFSFANPRTLTPTGGCSVGFIWGSCVEWRGSQPEG